MKYFRLLFSAVLASSALAIVAPALTSSPVQAASDITLSVSSAGEVLADTPTLIPVTLTAANPTGGDGLPGFNVTFSVIVPVGVSASGSPAPTSVSVVGGKQILVYENVGDVQEGSTFSFDVVLEAPAADFPVGSAIDIDANVFVNTDPRTVPDVAADGETATDSTSTDGGTSVTTLAAVGIMKISPDMNFGTEALRGVHDHVVEFVIDVFNTSQGDTNTSIVEDFIPASMEFLGCGGVDNTTDSPSNPGFAEEYPGAPLLTATAAPAGPCRAPILVESTTVAGGVITSGTSTNTTAAPAGVPDGVYTHVVWDTSTLPAAAPGAATTTPAATIRYQAGIPLLENVYDSNLFWDNRTGTVSTGTRGDPTANLDNNGLQAPGDNTPLYTNEEAAEESIANYASVGGDYAGPLAPGATAAQSDSTEFAYTIEDLAIGKDVAIPDPFLQGSVLDYTLTIRTSEYRTVTDMTVVDPISDGQCVLLGGTDPETVAPVSGECAIASPAPSSALLSLVENADGSWLMTWDETSDPNLGLLTASDEYVITFSTLLRESYQENFDDDAPTNGADAFANSVDLDGTSNLIPGIPDDPTFDAETIFDDGAVSFGTGSGSIDKSVSLPTAPGVELDCDAASWVRTDANGQASDTAPTPETAPPYAYRTGDRVCYRLGVDFPLDLNFRNPIVNDFLPPGFAFDQFWGNTTNGATADNTVIIDSITTTTNAAGDDIVDWKLGTQDPDTVGGAFEDDLFVSNGGTRFEVVFSAVVEREPENIAESDLMSNLMKFNTSNINGDTISLRDSADVEFVQPNVGIAKDTPDTVVVEGQVVPYTVTVTNNFSDVDGEGAALSAADLLRAQALAISNWDVLPPGILCADVTITPALDVPGTVSACADGIGPSGRSVIEFTIDSLLPQASGALTYSVTIPNGISAGQTLTNNAGVREYTGSDGTGGDPGSTYVPTSNIDTSQPTGNMPPALAEDTVVTPAATLGKIQQSQFEDTPGTSTNITNAPASADPDEATIGEQIVYTITDVLVPQGITMYNATVTDQIPAGTSLVSLDAIILDEGDGTVTAGTAASPPAGFTYAESGGLVTVTFPAIYANVNGTGDDTLDFTFTVVVDDTNPPNFAGETLENQATFIWETSPTGGQVIDAVSNEVVTTIVEPNPVIAKSNNAPSPAVPGAPITFTLTITNPDVGGITSNAYDVVVTDVLPDGLTLATNPDGGIPTGQTIVWDSATTAALAAIEPGQTVTITYTATVQPPAVASEVLTNNVDLIATSLPGVIGGERTYTDESDSDVLTPAAMIAKDVQPLGDAATDDAEFTLGQPIDYDFTVTVPSGVVAFDATAFDQLPSGLEFESFGTPVVAGTCETVSSAGVPSGTALAAGDIALLAPAVGGDANRLATFFGDLAAVGGDCTITVPYTVHVSDTAVGDQTNVVTFVWNSTDIITDDPAGLIALPVNYDDPAGDWNQQSDPAQETVTVVEPQLELDQDIAGAGGTVLTSPTCDTTAGNNTSASDDADGLPANGCDVEAGAEILKTLTITNTGTSDAYNTTVVETIPAGITPLVGVGGLPAGDGDLTVGPSGSSGLWDEGARTITWIVPAAIEPGTPLTLDFAAQLDDSDDLVDEQDFTFSADVPEYFGIPAAERATIVADNPLNDDIATYGATSGVRPADPDSATIEVHFPELTVTKDEVAPSDGSDAILDQPYMWRITVENTATVATAFDVDVTDMLPVFLTQPGAWTYVAASAVITSPNLAGVQTEPTGGPNGPLIWNDLDDLAPGEMIQIDLQVLPNSAILAPDRATGATNLGSDVVYTNAVLTTGDDASGSPTNNGGAAITDSDTDTVVIREIDLSVTKAVTNPIQPSPVYFGGLVEYTITATNDGPDAATGVELTDANLLDVGDPNDTILFVGVVSADRGTFDPLTGVWTVGDVAVGETLELVVSTRMNTTNPPESAVNEVEVTAANQFDTDSDPDNGFVGSPVEDDEALVSLDPLPSSLGNFVWLDLDGDGIQDATEPGIPDVPVVVTFTDPGGIPRQITVITDATGGWNVDPLFTDELAGGIVGLPVDTDLVVTVETTAPSLQGLTATAGAESDVDGGADSTSTQQINIGSPEVELQPDGTQGRLDVDFGYEPVPQSLGDRIWWDQDNSADATDGVGEYGIGGVDVDITWFGFDGVPGGGDDIVFSTATSDGTIDVDGDGNVDPAGTWNSRYNSLTGLSDREIPPGGYDVSVVPTSIPAGLPINTYDLDGTATPLLVEGITLDPGENQTDIDFSVTGEGIIGDTIWFDQNGDGVDDTNEPGISGVTATLTWAGPDGILGTPDDAVLTTVTSDGTTDVDGDGNNDPAGTYRFENLPDGPFQVVVDDTTLPADMTQTGDPDVTPDNTSLVTLDSVGGVTEDLDQDFGYQGNLSIGDLVFYDLDANGTGVVDGSDVPLGGVDVTIDYAGADGVVDTDDDFSITVTTSDGTDDVNGDGAIDPLGFYQVDGLPSGAYTVSVDPATLPNGITVPTYDFDEPGAPDTIATPNTSSTTLAGADDLDQNFSYTGAGSLGDTIWWDRNEDGIQDAIEPGYPGIPVVVSSDGLDGLPSTADDIVTFTVTSDGTTDVDGDGAIDPAGSYYVPNLPLDIPITVTVQTVSLPPTFPPTHDLDDPADGSVAAGAPNEATVTLASGEPEILDVDFGYNGPGAVGDLVWLDLNSDGMIDPEEIGLPNVPVEVRWGGVDGILGTADDIIATTVTSAGTTDVDGDGTIDPAGSYYIDGLPLGVPIQVTVDTSVLPADLQPMFDDDTTATPNVSTVTLTDLVPINTEQDFGYAGPGTLGDTVWYDVDAGGDPDPVGSGVFDGSDVPLIGVSVVITFEGVDGVFGTDDDFVITQITDTNGEYTTAGLPLGDYQILVDVSTLPVAVTGQTFDPEGTLDNTSVVTLDIANPVNLDQDFSYGAPGAVGDTIWFDQNGDGVVDPGEPGLAGIPVTITSPGASGDPADDISITVFTSDGANDVDGDGDIDPAGSYYVPNLPIGVPITVTVDAASLPPGMTPTDDDDGIGTPNTSTITLTVDDPIDTDQDFGYNGVGEIGDTIWFDVDGAGGATVDTVGGDVGFENVDVTLTWTNPTGGPDLVVTTTTDEDGMYIFTGLPEGDYTIVIDPTDLPAGLVPVYDPDATADSMSAVTLTDVEPSDLDQDFSFTGSGSIGDTIWHDRNGDGVVDTGEEPLPGVQVTITYTDPVNGSTFAVVVVTDADGTYDVENLPAGDYTITVDPGTLPQGYQPTYDDDGGLDSTSSITLGPGESNPDQDFGFRSEVDLGVVKSHVGDFVVGQEGTFNFAVDNLGPAVAEAPMVVTDTLPAGLTFVRSVGGDWNCVADGQIVTCTYVPGDLDVTTESEEFSIVVLTGAAAVPAATNVATISTPSVDTNSTNDETTDTVDVPLSRLALSKTLDGVLVAGQTATYRLEVLNEGPAVTSDPIVVVDDLPAGLTYVSGDGPGWVCSATGQRVECVFAGALAVDKVAAVSLLVDVTAGAGESITNSATVDGGVAISGDGDDTTDGVEPAPDLPRTGSDGTPAVLRIAAILLLLGVALTMLAGWRRRRHQLVVS